MEAEAMEAEAVEALRVEAEAIQKLPLPHPWVFLKQRKICRLIATIQRHEHLQDSVCDVRTVRIVLLDLCFSTFAELHHVFPT